MFFLTEYLKDMIYECWKIWKTEIIDIFPSFNIRSLNFIHRNILQIFVIELFHLHDKINGSVHLKVVWTVGHKILQMASKQLHLIYLRHFVGWHSNKLYTLKILFTQKNHAMAIIFYSMVTLPLVHILLFF